MNPLVTYFPFDLGDVQDKGFEGADYLVHCAYRPIISRQDREFGINVDIEGTKKIVALSRKYGIRMVFLSTTSAHLHSLSYYAKNKLLAENLFNPMEDLILRPGIVLGWGGGLFGKIASSLHNHKIVPLIGGGHQLTQVVALDDLCRVIQIGIKNHITGTYMVNHPTPVTTKELYHGIANLIGARPIFIPVPMGIIYQLTRLAEEMGFKLPFTSQNILGLKDLRASSTTSDLERFGLKIKDYKVTLAQLRHHI